MKQGQITLFIIIGLVMMISVIVAVALYSDFLDFRPPEEQTISHVPTELQPLASMIEQCQSQILDEGARILLNNGGYITPVGLVATLPPAGNSLALGDARIPYWHHLTAAGVDSEQPPLHGTDARSMSAQLATYVDERIEDCVAWDSFAQYTIERQEPVSTVSFSERQTSITTAWRMDVETAVGITEFTSFVAHTPAPVFELYETAQELVELYAEESYPEIMTMEWLALYAHWDSSTRLPPLYEGLRTERAVHIFPLAPAQDALKAVLQLTAENMQVINAQDAAFLYSTEPTVNRLHQAGMISLDSEPEDTRITTQFPVQSEVMWQVNNNPGAAIPKTLESPSYMNLFIPPLRDYDFLYTLSYPLLITLEQDGYVLRVGYEANIQNNEPALPGAQEQRANEEYCAYPGGSQATIRASQDAQAIYTCGVDSCFVGTVEEGELQTTLPTCANGVLELVLDENEYTDPVTVSSTAGEDVTISFTVYEPRPITLSVEQQTPQLNQEGDYVLGQTITPAQADIVMVRQGTPYAVQARSGDTVDLVPGSYEVYVLGVTEYVDEPYVLEEQLECASDEPIDYAQAIADCDSLQGQERASCLEEHACWEYPEQAFESLPTTYLELAADNLLIVPVNTDSITFIAAGFIPEQHFTTWDDIGVLGAIFDLGTPAADTAVRQE